MSRLGGMSLPVALLKADRGIDICTSKQLHTGTGQGTHVCWDFALALLRIGFLSISISLQWRRN